MKKSLCKIRFSTLILTILTFTFLFVPLALAKKPIGGGNGSGGKPTPESGVNNLSYPVIWAEGVTKALPGMPGMDPVMTGQWWYQWGTNGIDPNITPASCPPDPDESDPYLNPEGLPFCDDDITWSLTLSAGEPLADAPLPLAKAFLQKDAYNVWQAGSATPEGAGVAELDGKLFVDWIDWGDNLESVDWYTRSQVRTEVVLFQDLDNPMTEYEMRHTDGWGIDEVHGMAAKDNWYRLSEIFDTNTSYQPGDFVIYDDGEGDSFYIALLENLAPSTPPSSNGKWAPFVPDPFDSAISYYTGNLVEFEDNIYLATADNLSPAVSPGDQPVATIGPGLSATVYSHCARLTIQKLLVLREDIQEIPGALKWVPGDGWDESHKDYPDFDPGNNYVMGQFVKYYNDEKEVEEVYSADGVIPFTSVDPLNGEYWVEIISNPFAFDQNTSYEIGDFVEFNDVIYKAILDNPSIPEFPAVAPTNLTYWEFFMDDPSTFDAGTDYATGAFVKFNSVIYQATADNPRTSPPPGVEPLWSFQYNTGELINPHIFNGSVHEGGDGPGYYSAEINVKGRIIYGYTWNVRELNDQIINDGEAAGDYRITFSFDEKCGETTDLNTFFEDDVTKIIVPLEEEIIAAVAAAESDDSGDTGGGKGVLVPAEFDVDGNLIGGNFTYMDVRILERGGGGSKGGGKSH